MTRVYAEHYKDKFYLICEGHADYSEHGSDIVCSAISMLCYALEQWCLEYGLVWNHSSEIKDGYCEIAFEGSTEAETAYNLTVTGLRMLAKQYPKYVKFDIEA